MLNLGSHSNNQILRDKSLLYLKIDAIFSQTMGLLISSVFMTPILLIHGGSVFYIGLFTVIAYLTIFSQLISLRFLSKINSPKIICVVSSLIARLILLVIGLSLIFIPDISPMTIILIFLFFHIFSNVSSIAFSYWMYYLVPKEIRGMFFASRMKIALIIANLLALLLTIYIKVEEHNSELIYDYIPFIASLIGLLGLIFLQKVNSINTDTPLVPSIRVFRMIFKRNTLRSHIKSIFILYLAISMVTPFYTYYLLVKLNFSIFLIVMLNALSQLTLVVFITKWGELIDKFGVKPVLRLNAYFYIITFLIWPFTTLPEKYPLSLPLTLVIFFLIGISMGGLGLSANIISYKLLKNRDTAYGIIVNNISISLGSLTGSLLGTLLAIPFSYMELSLIFSLKFSIIYNYFLVDISDIDFLFLLAAIIGFISLSTMRNYRVIDEDNEEEKYVELILGLRRYMYNLRELITVSIENSIKRIDKITLARKKMRPIRQAIKTRN